MKTKLALATLACVAAFPAAAQNLIVEDAANNLVSPSLELAIGGPTGQVVAQTVTVETPGGILGVMLPAWCDGASLYALLLDVTADGLPGTTVIAGRHLTPQEVRGGARAGRFALFITGPFAEATPGARYAVVLASLDGECRIRQSTPAAAYPGGKAYYYSLPELRWIALSEQGGPDDLPFRVLAFP